MVTDPIADMLTRIRNGYMSRHEQVDIPASNIKKAIAEILLAEGYVKSVELVDGTGYKNIRIGLKYSVDKQKVITGIKRISKPGLRVYAKSTEIPKVLGGLGVAILSTSKGIITDRKARADKVGGEVLCYVW